MSSGPSADSRAEESGAIGTVSGEALEIRVLNGGYCRQLLGLVDRRTWRVVRFHAVFLAVRHHARGWVLIDTGYGDRFTAATRAWPWRLYAVATPVQSGGSTRQLLQRAGIYPEEVQDIVLTHLHADHVGGVSEFPNARFHVAGGAWEALCGMRPFAQLRRAFLPALFPKDFASRLRAIDPAAFQPDPRWPALRVFDLWGDGSMHLVALPGHALGHCGVLLRDAAGEWLYAADAYWNWRQIERGAAPLWPATCFLEDARAYRDTIDGLRSAHRAGLRMLACHCPKTQAHVTPTG